MVLIQLRNGNYKFYNQPTHRPLFSNYHQLNYLHIYHQNYYNQLTCCWVMYHRLVYICTRYYGRKQV